MKQFNFKKSSRRLLTAFMVTLFAGTMTANAETKTESFEDWGNTVADGWELINGATYGNTYTYDYVVGSDNFTPSSGSNCLANSSHSAAQGTTSSPMIVTPAMTGTLTFKFRKYNSSSSTKGYINIFEYDETTSAATGTSIWTCRPNYTNEATSTYQTATITVGDTPKRYAIYLAKVSIDEFKYSPAAASTEGPGLAVSGYKNGETFAFGIVDAGSQQTITLNNPGTAEVNVTITTTGGYTATPTKAAIAAKGSQAVAITVPTASANGTITITPAEAGVDAITINLTCTVKDPSKMFEDFSGNALPTDWETEAIGSNASSYSWSFANGYAEYAQGSQYGRYYDQALVSPLMVFASAETVMFKAKKAGTYNPYMVVESYDGSTWTATTEGAFNNVFTDNWTYYTVTIPSGATRIRFNGCCFAIDEIYGGKLDATPRPKLEVVDIANGGTLSWGNADVAAGTEKTITLKNDGTLDLGVTISATKNYTVNPASGTVTANGGTLVVTIGTPANDGPGVLTITPANSSGLEPYIINLTSYYKVPKAVMGIDKKTIDFGKVTADAVETITVSNTGDATLTATIASNNEKFVVSKSNISVNAGETGTFTITYKYTAGVSGQYSANITVTPNDGSAVTITATANNKRTDVWSEDFENGIPASWTNDGWTVNHKWNEESSVKHASAGASNGYLITPRLKADANEKLTFDYLANYSTLVVEWADDIDATTWNNVGSYTENQTITFTAPSAGTYFLRFSGSGSFLDNFEGFQLDQLAADAIITASTLPTTGNQYAPYEASVTVENKGTEAQTAVAKLYFQGTVVDTQEKALAVDGKSTIDLSFTPEEAVTDAAVKIEVTLKNVATFAAKSVEGTVTIAPVETIDETKSNTFEADHVYSAIRLNYTPKNGWNSICLPFEATNDQMTQIFGEGWKAYYFSSYDGTSLKFQKATFFRAGVPFLIYIESARTGDAPVLTNVTIKAAEASNDTQNGAIFQGTYAPMAAGTLTGKYGVIPATGKIVKGDATTTMKGFRAYFELPANSTAPTISIDGETTGIEHIEHGTLNIEHYYDLQGRRTQTSNLNRGLYIVNGKKVVIK